MAVFTVINTVGLVYSIDTNVNSVAVLEKNSGLTNSISGDIEGGLVKLTDTSPIIESNIDIETTANQYLQSIHQLESEGGAYASRLWEKVQGLALAYYNQGKNKEAVAVFQKALHIHRVNNGLYNVEQIPILQQMINNFIQLESFSRADDNQYYLYRTRLRNYEEGDAKLIDALTEYAHWQREAYLLKIGEHHYQRLISMNDLQTKALTLIENTYGTNDTKMLPVLEDLLDTQYLISSYSRETVTDTSKVSPDKTKFDYLRLVSYSKGVEILKHKIAIYENDLHSTIYARAEAIVALGDWYQWHKKHSQALKMYTLAHQLMASHNITGDRLNALFGSPRALPTTGVFDSELTIPKAKKKGYIVAQFDVTNNGIAREINFLKSEPEQYTRRQWRIRKSIKKTLFRPRFENALPVTTERVVHRYVFYY